MELLQLRYFVAVVNSENMTKAAEFLHISQPSLSQTIHRLENELQVKLFEHVGRNIRLTREGRSFYTQVTNILSDLDTACKSLNDDALKGDITIGTYTPLIPIVPYLKEFSKRNPQVTYTIYSINERNSRLARNLDLLLLYANSDVMNFRERRHLYRASTMTIVPRDYPLEDYTSFNPEKLAGMPLVSYMAEDGKPLRHMYEEISRSGYTPNIRYKTNSARIQQEVMEYGLAGGFTNELIFTHFKDTGDYTVVPGTMIRYTDIDIAWQQDGILSPAALEFKRFIENDKGEQP